MAYVNYYHSPLGRIILKSEQNYLTGLWFADQKYCHARADQCQNQNLPIFEQTVSWLDLYFSGQIPNFTPLLKFIGTPFRRIVWHMLLEIAYGHTETYGQLAQKVAHKLGKAQMSAQAIGGAVSHNPIALIIPCHRVIGKNMQLTGYAAGLKTKQFLLQLEHSKHNLSILQKSF